MIKKKLLSLLLVFAMVMGILPFGAMEAYAAEPVVNLSGMIFKNIVDTKGDIWQEVEIQGTGFVDESRELEITKVRLYTNPQKTAGVTVEMDGEITDTSIMVTPTGEMIPGSTYYPMVTYRYKNDIGNYEYKDKFLETGIKLENVPKIESIPINKYNREMILEITGTDLATVSGGTVTAKNVYLKNEFETQLTSISSNNVTADKDGDKYVLKIKLSEAKYGKNEVIIANGIENGKLTNQGIYRSIIVVPTMKEMGITSVSPRSGDEDTEVTIKANYLYKDMEIEFGNQKVDSESIVDGLTYDEENSEYVLKIKAPKKAGDEIKVPIKIDGKQIEIEKNGNTELVNFYYIGNVGTIDITNLNPSKGTEGRTVDISIEGKHFQDIEDKGIGEPKWESLENSVGLSTNEEVLEFTREVTPANKPLHWPEGAVERTRELRVNIQGNEKFENGKFVLENNAAPDSLVQETRVGGYQNLNVKIKLPEVYPEPLGEDMDIVIEVVNIYYDDSGNKIETVDAPSARESFYVEAYREPNIDEVSIMAGPVEGGEKPGEDRVIAEIKGSNFLVEGGEEGKEPEIPMVFLVPVGDYENVNSITLLNNEIEKLKKEFEDGTSTDDFDTYIANNGSSNLKTLLNYKAEVKEDQVYEGIAPITGNSIVEYGDRMVVSLPSSKNTGDRKLLVINPDGGTRLSEGVSFEYKNRMAEGNQPKILSIDRKYVNFRGEEFTITAQNVPVRDNSKVKITIDGTEVEVISIETNLENTSEQILKVKSPEGPVGPKIIQIRTESGDGLSYGLTSYNYQLDGVSVSDETFEYIDDSSKPDLTGGIFPEEGGPGTPVYIHGEGFKPGSKVIIQGSRKDETIEVIPEKIWQNGKIIYFEIPSLVEQNNQLKDKFAGDEAYIKTGPKDISVKSEGGAVSDKTYKFEYRNPVGVEDVKITAVNPDYTIKGTDINVAITGENFKSGITVLFGGRKADVVSISGDGKKLVVKAPPYVTAEIVDVVVYNKDTGWDKLEDGFEYLESGETKPEITMIYNTDTLQEWKGSLSGNETVRITVGPFIKTDKLPKVYFDGMEASHPDEDDDIKTEWKKNKDDENYTLELYVKTPAASKAGPVDVIVTNPRDASGIALSEGEFVYESSSPEITDVYEKVIPKNGGKEIYIKGSGFMEADASGYNTASPSKGDKVDMEVEVQFGAESEWVDIFGTNAVKLDKMDSFDVIYYPAGKKDNSGNPINNSEGKSINIEVVKKGEGFASSDASGNVSAHIDPGEPLYASLRTSGTADISEGIKIEVDSDRVYATRQMSIMADVRDGGKEIAVKTPPMLRLEKGVKLTVVNKDGGSAEWTGLEVKNPGSAPKIVDIDDENKEALRDEKQEILEYRVSSGVKGGKPFNIRVTDFIDGAVVSIGDQEYSAEDDGYEVISREGNGDVWLKVTPNDVSEKASEYVGKQLPIMVLNPDGGSANSIKDITVGNPKRKAYFMYKENESNPVIESIDPKKGSTLGGKEVTISGSGFKYPDVEVWFGSVKAEIDMSKDQSSSELHVLSPPVDSAEKVPVYVENTKEYGQSNSEEFEYTASPVIISIKPDIVKSFGGEKVEIIGKGFESGSKVKIGDKEVKTTFIDEFKLEIVTPEVPLPSGVDELKMDVTVTNTNGESDTAEEGITFIRPFPTRPTGFKATPQHGRTIFLEWDAQKLDKDDAAIKARYRIEMSTSENGPFSYLGEVSDDESRHIVRDLASDKTYYFRLWALNQYGQSQGFATANAKTKADKDDDQSGEFEDTLDKESEVVESNGNVSINYAKEYKIEDYTHDLTASKYQNYRTITLNLPASVINEGKGNLNLKHIDIEIKSAISMLKSSGETYRDDETLKVTITKLFDGEQSSALKYAPSGYRTMKQGIKVEYSVGNGRNNRALDGLNGIYLKTYIDTPSLSSLKMYSYRPGETSLTVEGEKFNRVYSDIYRKEVYIVDSYIKRSGYYIPFGK